ncbi:hypothetical protein DSUL_20152 [Desulfovibrionales bacterium]
MVNRVSRPATILLQAYNQLDRMKQCDSRLIFTGFTNNITLSS